MKSKQIEIGGLYLVKVSGKVVAVKVLEKVERYNVLRQTCRDNWLCRSEATGRVITVRSAQRFRGVPAPRPLP